MNEYDVKRLALTLSVQAEIEGMKAANTRHPDDQPYSDEQFQNKASELRNIAYAHNDQL